MTVKLILKPTSSAQLDARLTGDQKVAGSTRRVGNIPLWIMKYFSTVIFFLPLVLIQEGHCQLSVSGERMCTILVNRLEN